MRRLHPAAFIVPLLVLTVTLTGCSSTEVAQNVTPPPAQSASTPTVTAATIDTSAAEAAPATSGNTVVAAAPAASAAVTTTEGTDAPPTDSASTAAPAGAATVEAGAPVTQTNAAAADPGPTSTPPPGVVAMANGQAVMQKDYDRQFSLQQAALVARGQDLKTDEGKKLVESIRQQVLEDMINFVLIDEAAQAQGITITQKMVDAAAEKSIKDGGGRAGFEKWLKDTGQTEADYKAMVRVGLVTDAIGNKITGKLPEKAPQVHARHILFDSPDKAQQALKELQAGKDFAATAKKYTIDQSTKDNGGDLGWFPRNTMPPEIDEVVFNLPVKKLSTVVKDSFGAYHILQVLEKDNSRELSKDQVHALSGAAFGRWLAERRLAAKIDRYIEFKD
jgi:foldase protein PrsA